MRKMGSFKSPPFFSPVSLSKCFRFNPWIRIVLSPDWDRPPAAICYHPARPFFRGLIPSNWRSAEEGRSETKYPENGDGKINLPSRAVLRNKWKTLLAVSFVSIIFFSMGTFANQVIVQQVQSLAGNHVLVPAPELQIVSSSFIINGTASLLTAVVLNVTTVGQPGSPAGTKLYQVFIQVSCLNAAGVEFTCATGSNTITLPTNMAGTQAILVVPVSPAIDPETTEVHDLSFIVTGTPSPVSGCQADFSITASPTVITLNDTGGVTASAKVVKTITSLCNFSGTVTLSIKLPPVPGFTATPVPAVVTIPPGGSATITEVITATNVPAGAYPITNIATSGSLSHAVTIQANVINTPPPCTPGFTITATPPQLTFTHGTNSTQTVTKIVTSNCGFSGTVSLNETVVPLTPGIFLSLTPNSVAITPTTSAAVTDTILVTSKVPIGTYSVLVSGFSGTATAQVKIIVQVV